MTPLPHSPGVNQPPPTKNNNTLSGLPEIGISNSKKQASRRWSSHQIFLSPHAVQGTAKIVLKGAYMFHYYIKLVSLTCLRELGYMGLRRSGDALFSLILDRPYLGSEGCSA